ncbi:MAG: class I SAM-dependent methyltransferase [Pseudonocardia sp.]
MSEADRQRWNARHAAMTDDVALPPDALRDREHLLPGGGRALDVACGRGAVAVWLAGRGFAVDAVDVSGTALAAGAALARHTGTVDRVRWWCHDLDGGLPAGCVDTYAVVVCQRFRDPALYPELVARLGAGGLLVVSVLTEVGNGTGPYRAPPGELLGAFGALEVLAHAERDGEASIVARRP